MADTARVHGRLGGKMGFAEDIYRLASQVSSRQAHCKGNEEATKHSLILPFFQMMGYDIYDPSVLVPEYKAGFANSKEKIDYAILLKGNPVLFIEAKAVGDRLDNHDAQLAKYFNSTPALRIAIITNGVRYKFFTDLKEPNLLDPDPFFEFTLETITPEEVEILKGFREEAFNPSELVMQAENLVYLRAIKRKFRSIFREPSDEFVRFIAGDIFPKKITANALERLTPLVRQAMSTVLVEMVSQGLSQEITKPEEVTGAVPAAAPPDMEGKTEKDKAAPVTTEEELAGFKLVYQLVADGAGDDPRIQFKDTSSYLGIHIEKSSRWFARLFFNGNQKYVVTRVPVVQANILLGNEVKAEEITSQPDVSRININHVDDLVHLRAVVLAAYRTVSATSNA